MGQDSEKNELIGIRYNRDLCGVSSQELLLYQNLKSVTRNLELPNRMSHAIRHCAHTKRDSVSWSNYWPQNMYTEFKNMRSNMTASRL